ncbi:MAG: intracellular septation protein [Pseudomonadota bacterium]|nr:intracellular septation protein [Pseudomonadota bacterium]MDQ5881538.1 intracellular septation protein [Pseudomonadota bacterium]MDQ5905242.1 intracellular septation protein [Pseudomonadota bacterium]MDQ5916461.1 intracellular septation protein [Pseudomonadota bacterium]MDQ5917983.1 intracellular septation protein [Pseudomonadota bacterium]
MKFLFDLFPVILFFIAFKVAGIFVATAVAIVATFAQIGWVWYRHRKVDTMLWVSLVIVTVFGGATLLLQDETFIKWKPTVLYWLFAGILGGGALFMKKNLMKSLLSEQMQLPDVAWNRMNLSWIGFFVFMGIANLAVAYNFSTDDWVTFKLFGGMGLMLIFVLVQGLLLSKYIEEKQ